jgi:hypothetical protein
LVLKIMTIEANVWNKANSYWSEMVDSASITINVSINDQVSFDLIGVPGVGSGETGFITQTAPGNFEARTITGTANEISVANGSGQAGNPTISLPAAIVLTGKTVQNLITAAGTTAIPSATLTAGTNLTTATAGALENDGKAFYATNVASSRQVINAEQFASITTNRNGSDANTAQSIFDSANDVLTLAASTSYMFEAVYFITRAAGSTSHVTTILFGGTATFTSIGYLAAVSNLIGTPPTVTLTNAQHTWATAASGLTVIGTSVATTENLMIKLRGIVRVNGAGTIIPQFQYSAAPGGAPTFRANSFIRFWPVGSDAVAAVGNWA